MTDPALQSQIEAAEAYEALFVPALFGEWAPRVAEASRARAGERVLDVACGTGALAREIAKRTGTSGSVVGVDPSAGMLAVAGRLASGVEWRRGQAEALPFDDRSFDLVVSQFGLMLFADPATGVREMLRVTRPEGRLAVAVWNRLDENPGYLAEVELLQTTAGTAAADAVRLPFRLGDRERLASLFEEAGAGSVVVTAHAGSAAFPDLRTMIEAEVRGWLPAVGVALDEATIERVLREAESALADWVREDGRVAFPTSALIVTASA